MAKKKRVTRKQLLKEPDEFLTFSSKMLQYAAKHKTPITWVVSALVAIALIATGTSYLFASAENRAFEMLDQNMRRYASAAQAGGPAEAISEVEEDFELLVDRYGGRRGGKFARLMYADICFKAGRLDRTIELNQQSLVDFGDVQPYRNLVLSSLGAAHEEKGEYESAARYFEMITSDPEGILRDEALFSLGRIYAAMGQEEASTAAYKQLIADYPGFVNIEIARDKIN